MSNNKNDNDKLSKEFAEFLEFKKYKQQLRRSEQPAQTNKPVDVEKPRAVVERETIVPKPVDGKRMAMVAYLKKNYFLKDKGTLSQLKIDELKRLTKTVNRFFIFCIITSPIVYKFANAACTVSKYTPLEGCLKHKALLVGALNDLSTWGIWTYLISFAVIMTLGYIDAKLKKLKKEDSIAPSFCEKSIDRAFYFDLYPKIIRFFCRHGKYANEKEFKKLIKSAAILYMSFFLVPFVGVFCCIAWIFFAPIAHLKLVHLCAQPSNFQKFISVFCLLTFIFGAAVPYVWMFRLVHTMWVNRRIKKRIKRERKRA